MADKKVQIKRKPTPKWIHKSPKAKRSEGQREQDLVLVARMYLKGHTQVEITDVVNKGRPKEQQITRSQVRHDIETIRTRWIETYIADYDQLKAKELARIDELEHTYWEAWEQSKASIIETDVENVTDQTGTKYTGLAPSYQRTKGKRKETTSHGDKRYLEGIQWCIEQRCKILGFFAGNKVQIDWRTQAEQAGIDHVGLFNEMVGKYISELDGDGGSGSLD